MKKDVLIKIIDNQTTAGESEVTETLTKGTFSGDSLNYKLHFTERFDEEFSCETTLHVENEKCVTMLRRGAYNSELIIEQDRRHNCHYSTPYGEFMIGIYAKSVNSNISEAGGMLRMNYTIDFYAGLAAENEITVEINSLDKAGDVSKLKEN